MLKSVKNAKRMDKMRFKIPKSTQDLLPFDSITPDGIMQCGKKFMTTFRIEDINYSIASEEDQVRMFQQYSAVLNSLDAGVPAKITIVNQVMAPEGHVLLQDAGDDLDAYRWEYNRVIRQKTIDSTHMSQQKMITLSIERDSLQEARAYFNRTEIELQKKLSDLGSGGYRMTDVERMRLFHCLYRPKHELFLYDLKDCAVKGHTIKDYIAPDAMQINTDHFMMDDLFGRVLFVRNFASYVRDNFVDDMTALPITLALSIDLIPVSTDEAVSEAEKRILGVETNIVNWQQRQNRQGNFSSTLPYQMQQQREETKDFLHDLTQRDQRMFFACVTVVHFANSKEQLDLDTDTLCSTAGTHRCDLGILRFQQLEGLHTALPFGHRRINVLRTMTTESTAVLIPFRTQDLSHPNGIYYGANSVSGNLILVDRSMLQNGNMFVLGVSGSGKSYAAKREISTMRLRHDCDIIVIDPEREYAPLVSALGGEVIQISPQSHNYLNAMDINPSYGDSTDPLAEKSDFVLSLAEMASGGLSQKELSLIDRVMRLTYKEFIASAYQGTPPTLRSFYDILKSQKEAEAQEIALKLEMYISGTFNVFAHETNVNFNNSFLCFDINQLGKQLMSVGLLVVLDAIMNRISRNRAQHRTTYVYIDEIYLLFMHKYSSDFLYKLWKRIRKYGGYIAGITQNVSELLQSADAQQMLSNSEFLIMLNQSANDRDTLAALLKISDTQLSYVTNANAGAGLLRVGRSHIPFQDEWPADTELYKLMTTKPQDLREYAEQTE